MIRAVFALAFAFVWASALDISHLSDDLQSAIAHKEASIEAGRKRLKYDFIGDIKLSGSISKNRAISSDDWEQSESAGASFSQDLFRSGGITASMRYADFWAEGQRLSLAQEKNGYLQNLAVALLQAKQDQIKLDQNDLSLKNAEIALLIKRRQYEVGETDITQLNDALQTRNSLQKTRLDLLNAQRTRFEEIAKITPIAPDKIPLDRYEPISAEFFAANSIAARLAKVQSAIAKAQQSVESSSYLPTLSANAGVNYSHDDLRDGESYNYGLTLTMPLSVTEGWSMQEKRLETLRAESQERVANEEARRIYAQSASAIDAIEKSVAVLNENIRLYDSLISVAAAQAKSGDRSRYDVQTLENTRQSDKLEIESNKISIEIERAKLYYATEAK